MDNLSTSPHQPRCQPGQGCANPRTALPEPPAHPRVIPVRTGVVRSLALDPPRLSTSAVHLSTSLLLLVTRGHDRCLKCTRRSAQTRVVPAGDSAATGRHGLWITGGQPRRIRGNDRVSIAAPAEQALQECVTTVVRGVTAGKALNGRSCAKLWLNWWQDPTNEQLGDWLVGLDVERSWVPATGSPLRARRGPALW